MNSGDSLDAAPAISPSPDKPHLGWFLKTVASIGLLGIAIYGGSIIVDSGIFSILGFYLFYLGLDASTFYIFSLIFTSVAIFLLSLKLFFKFFIRSKGLHIIPWIFVAFGYILLCTFIYTTAFPLIASVTGSCSMATTRSSLENCFERKAIETKDVRQCENITVNPNARLSPEEAAELQRDRIYSCYTNFAVHYKDPSICELIDSAYNASSECYEKVGMGKTGR